MIIVYNGTSTSQQKGVGQSLFLLTSWGEGAVRKLSFFGGSKLFLIGFRDVKGNKSEKKMF